MKTNSKKLIRMYQNLVHWYDGLWHAACCSTAERYGFKFTEEELKKIWEAEVKLSEAKRIVQDIFSKRIGEQITLECGWGEHKK